MASKKTPFWGLLYIFHLFSFVFPVMVSYEGFRKNTKEKDVKYFLTHAKTVEVDYHVTLFTMRLTGPIPGPVSFSFVAEDENIAYPLTRNISFNENGENDATIPKVIHVYGKNVGRTKIKVASNSHSSIKSVFNHGEIPIIVVYSLLLQSINAIIGWIYFVAWSISFYPQVYINFKRKSVVGLNFDFLAYNITGFLCYSIFNGGLYYSKTIQEEYFTLFPGSVIPVLANDVFFAFHAVILTCVTIVQCLIYDRGGQTVSRVAKVILALMWAFVIFSLIPSAMRKITWMMYLNFLSYVKLAITLIKYIPQAYMNYQRKSTMGWSIGNVLLDFTGGSLSMLQMFFISYNNDQWNSLFGDFTKFGLGLFSILFDLLFVTQHYILYRKITDLERFDNGDAMHAFENPQADGVKTEGVKSENNNDVEYGREPTKSISM